MTTVKQVADKFKLSKDIVISDSVVGTGDTISLIIHGELKDSVTALVSGDVNGDGRITTADYIKVKKAIVNPDLLTGIFFDAADINGDNTISAADYAKIKGHLKGNNKL